MIKYFNAESYEAAKIAAVEYFKCEENRLTIEVVAGGENALYWLILAFYGTPLEYENMNGGFGLFYEKDGVYLELYEKRGNGVPFDRAELSLFLRRKRIKGLNGDATLTLTAKGRGREKIAEPQNEYFYGEYLLAEVAQNEMEVTAKLLAPQKGGAMLTLEEAKDTILQLKVVHGLDEQVLNNMLTKKEYGKTYVVAKATPPEDGENGRIIYHFQTEKKLAKPKEIERGKVDYKSLDLYESVEEGQLLVTRVPATPGKLGISVLGKELKQKPGKEAILPKSKNTIISEDRLTIHSKLTGLVELVGGSVNVSNIYKVEGDCGLSVGNIDFDGSVYVTGNVVSGHMIKATGSVIVGGVVEASSIIADGNVEIKRGMQGMDKGRIEAGGSISILYIERGTAIAGETLNIDASIHSDIEAGKSIQAKGKRGSIIGGHARAGGEIIANSIGSVSHAQTEFEVGFMPQKRSRMVQLEDEINRISEEQDKLEKLELYLDRASEKMSPEALEKLNKSTIESRLSNELLLEEYLAELEELRIEADNATNGKVHVFGTAYPGVRITIATATYKINNEQTYSTFKYHEGEILFLPCELKRS